ncbi:MAG: sigma 54-interacting transcriptional regulator [Thermodesulfobacteriota bacterium]
MNATVWPLIEGLGDQSIELLQLMDEIPMGILIIDSAYRVALMNRAIAALTGYAPAEALGLPCHYVLRSNLCTTGCPVRQLTERGMSLRGDANMVNRSREKIPVRFTASVVKGSGGALIGYLKTVEDMRYLQRPDGMEARALFGRLIGKSAAMENVSRVLPAIAETDSAVLITGETGTGKDYVAEALHNASPRSKGPFIKINCGALPESLLESELFGHQKGAFTGAVENKPGRFRLADKGTLYLTEIGDLPLNLQVKLLSFLDDRIIFPLGSTHGLPVDVRIIAGTHRDLEKMVAEGRFREDLLFRLNVVRLHLPPLAQREDDIDMLMDHFLQLLNARFKKMVSGFSPEARRILKSFHFPGNVRELRNMVEYAVNLCDGNEILVKHLPPYVVQHSAKNVRSSVKSSPEPSGVSRLSSIQTKPAGEWILPPAMEHLPWHEAERRMILDALLKARGQKAKAAEYLGWARSTLWRKMKSHGIMP